MPAWDRTWQWLDLLGCCDWYEALTNFVSPGVRRLTARERNLLEPIFGSSLPYNRIRIDERAYLGPRQGEFLYVSFHTINSWGPISSPTLVHEAVHVWQYVHLGALYIPRALAAQQTEMGYNYGGSSALRANTRLEDFNYEQMADLVEDAFRIANGYRAQWISETSAELPLLYVRYLEELRSRILPRAYQLGEVAKEVDREW